MRVGCLQFAPCHGNVDANMAKANNILDGIGLTAESELDFLVLPKMAFSGTTKLAPKDHLEPVRGDKTQTWATVAAEKYKCDVVVGYPQEVDKFSAPYTRDEFFSSAIVAMQGEKDVVNCPERTLDRESPVFTDIDLELGRVSIAQYTDFGDNEYLNDRECRAFADHIVHHGVDMAIFPMAWTIGKEPDELPETCGPSKKSKLPENTEQETLSWWIARLWPVVEARLQRDIWIVLCNRVGREGDDVYAGTSTVLCIRGGEVFVHEYMESHKEGLLLVDTSDLPRWRLVEADSGSEQDNESVATADSPQSGPLTPDTSYRGSEISHEDRSIPSEHDAAAAAGAVYSASRNRTQPVRVTVKGQARPKLDIPKMKSKPPQEIPVKEYTAQAAAAVSKPRSNVSAPKVRSPEDSTPHPGGSHGCLHWHQRSRGFTARPFEHHSAAAAVATPIEDPKTAISMSPQRWSGPWSSCRKELEQARPNPPARPKAPRAGRSQSLSSAVALGPVGRRKGDMLPAIKRPASPKARNVTILEPLILPTWKALEDCGIIPILASPSIMTTDSQAGSEASRGRRRRHRRSEEYEENSRSSSRDSTRNAVLHRRMRRSDVEDDSRCRLGAKRSQSAVTQRPRDPPRSASEPTTRRDPFQNLGAAQVANTARSEPRFGYVSKNLR
ncbi:asparagine amidohydrolase [Cordyceps fumosorosea ARSEF 2679]|uniref:Asparagine amidohydrolase n=1 Tax=Cordyceps fumosorosea (strain ARSEF 2679) TaxID=1081104 RepID=A0A168DDY4_CORFA|nr:asparagine amidohydrolase [Cordyceps fumosorosea ARSEF 2679]OAA72491.1 asparagine amidohydrolase [Cordyceps fumosorosea ARSEF 2679]